MQHSMSRSQCHVSGLYRALYFFFQCCKNEKKVQKVVVARLYLQKGAKIYKFLEKIQMGLGRKKKKIIKKND